MEPKLETHLIANQNGNNQDVSIGNICYIGAGYVGGISAVVMASKNPSIGFHVADVDEERISAWNSSTPPMNERGLSEILRRRQNASAGMRPNLIFSTNLEGAIKTADMIFIAVDTPLKQNMAEGCSSIDLCHFNTCIESIARSAQSSKIIVIKSTVPCGTADATRCTLKSLARSDVEFTVLFNPEFLAEGTAIANLLYPDRVVIGSDQDETSRQAAKVLGRIYEELTKLSTNALLAQRISSINTISAICEEMGGDVRDVSLACGLDKRIGPHMLNASLGFGGSCLNKDVLALAQLADNLTLGPIGSYWRSVSTVNEFQKSRFTDKIVHGMKGSLCRKNIAVLGCAFKRGTGDVRESPAVTLIADLLLGGARVTAYDPRVNQAQLIEALLKNFNLNSVSEPWLQRLEMQMSIYGACYWADAIVIATDLEELSPATTSSTNTTSVRNADGRVDSSTNWSAIADHMRDGSKLVFDGCNVVDAEELTRLGFEVHTIGRTATQGLNRVDKWLNWQRNET